MVKKPLDVSAFKDSDWKLLEQVQVDIEISITRKPLPIYFFAKDGVHSFCRRYNREVDFKRDVEDTGLCAKCGMRFWIYSAAQICVFIPSNDYYTIDDQKEGAELDAFPDKEIAEMGVANFDSKNWE